MERMKKMLFTAMVFMLAISCAVPTGASEVLDGVVSLGQDHVQMTWYALDSGRNAAGELFVVVRKYYTNIGIKDRTIELLMSKFGTDPETAGKLYFTEYIYTYSQDMKMFSFGYIRHYDDVGRLIHGTEMDGLTEETKPVWAGVEPRGPSGLALNVARRRGN